MNTATRVAGSAAFLLFLLIGCEGESQPRPELGGVDANLGDAGSHDASAERGVPPDVQTADSPVATSDALADVRLSADLQNVNAGDEWFAGAAGLWTGLTSQNLPVSLILSEDGTVTDVNVRLLLTYADGGTCSSTFVGEAVTRIVNGRVRLNVSQTQIGGFRVPIEIGLTSGTVAVGSIAGWTGTYNVRCADEVGTGTGELIPPGTFEVKRLRGVTVPAPGDQAIATAYGGPTVTGVASSGCSRPVGGNVHCAFTRTSPLGETQLWVTQVNGAPSSPGALCGSDAGTTSPTCRLLSSALFLVATPTGTNLGTHRFIGDTLFFQAVAPRADGTLAADYHAWRPGWAASRVLVEGADACTADELSDAVVCTAGFKSSDTGPLFIDLWAGHLGDGTQPLTKIARPMILRSVDQTKTPKPFLYNYALSPGGEYLLWSARAEDTATAKETLWFHRLGEPLTNIRTYGTDIGRWRLSRDGVRLYWLANIDRDVPGVFPGSLYAGSFPDRTIHPMILVRDDVAAYVEAFQASTFAHPLWTLGLSGSLTYHRAAEMPGSGTSVADGVSQVRSWSPDGRFLAYAKEVDATPWSDLFVARVTPTLGTCALQPSRSWRTPIFSTTGNKLMAIRYVGLPTVNNELVAIDPVTCARQMIAANPGSWGRIGADLFAIGFEYQSLRRFGMVSLGILDLGRSANLVTRIDGVSDAFAVATTGDPANPTLQILYGVNAGWRSDGLYRRTVTLPTP
ncbi:MAG TPA: hypothetical protein VGG33_00470 [Polyangia bacterium]